MECGPYILTKHKEWNNCHQRTINSIYFSNQAAFLDKIFLLIIHKKGNPIRISLVAMFVDRSEYMNNLGKTSPLKQFAKSFSN